MAMDGKEKEYELMEKRPRVLANSFRKSRDNWKRKCQETKAEVKSFRDRVRDLELSRSKWRDDAEEAQREKQRLQEEIEQLQSQLILSAESLAQSEKKTVH